MKPIEKYAYRMILAITVVLISAGTIIFHHLEKWTYIDSFYYCIVTLSTVGYGDFVPKSETGRLIASFYIIIGVGVLAAFINTLVKRRGKLMLEKRGSKQSKTDS